jgi:PAS domain S-box-containing protein
MNIPPSLAARGLTGDPEILWRDGERAFSRIRRAGADGGRDDFIIVFSTAADQTPELNERMAHEYALKDYLESAWALRPIEILHERGQSFLMIASPKGEPLVRHIGAPMEMGQFLSLAISLSVGLGRMHGRGLVHKDIKPANVFINFAQGSAWLTGFGIASHLPRERQAPKPPELITGTLPYMAPEQTGRMNRAVDSRSDLYALGVTLYQLLTGNLPFTASDPLEWMHCHIARKPLPPKERRQDVPGPVSAIIMKLLAKTAEERYQTAAGVEHDFRQCLAEWQARRRIDDLPLGKQDVPDRLLIPEKLYGREGAIDTLLASFDRVVANGRPQLVLVSGYSGIGKSSVVNELHKVLALPRGLFASGKFDQYKRDIPYATLAQAFQSLIRQLLGKPEDELSKWRQAFREALDPNGLLIADLVPELKFIIGEPPSVPDLPPQDAKARFQLVMRRFIGVFARAEHPLALFLDDLQWLDAATLDLLQDLLTQTDVHHLLLIGAYRDNEVSGSHPLMTRLEAISRSGATVHRIVLAPLTSRDLTQLVSDSLYCDPSRVAPLVRLIHEKTGGNPFFVIQFIAALAEEGLLYFDHDRGRWHWNIRGIRAKGYSDNVIDLMVDRLNRLPVATLTALQHLACVGNSAETATLCIVHDATEKQVHADLWEALRQDLVLRSDESYEFAHDRIQEAAYSLIPHDRRAEFHLRIGRQLASHTSPDKRDEAIFEIVNQLNRGAELVTSRDERERMAELNLIAGKRAQAAAAYTSALSHMTTGAMLLPDDCWQRRRDLIFALELARAQCEFVLGAVATAEERLQALSTRAKTTVEKTTVACWRVDLYMSIDRSAHAIEVGLEQLRYLGIDWPSRPTEDDAKREYDRIWPLLGDRKIEDLVDLPAMADLESLATMDLLIRVAIPGFFASTRIFAVAVCRAVSLSLEGGNSDASCIAYELFAMLAGPHFGNYDAGYRFGRLGCDLVERPEFKRFQARTYETFGFVIPWTKHVRSGRDLLVRSFEIANRSGDITYAGYACGQIINNYLMAGDPLSETQKEAENGLDFAEKVRFGLIIGWTKGQLGFIRTLRGLTRRFGSFDDEEFNELEFERYLASSPALALPECWYWIRKLQARYFAGDYAAALYASAKAQPKLWTSLSLLELPEYHFYDALSLAACWDSASADERREHLQTLSAHREKLEAWAQNCPENFENRVALVSAEIARIENRALDAEHLYEQAIRSARENGFVHNEALANELAARFYGARGFEKIANTYRRDARSCYLRWGADGKVRQLDRLYPHLADEKPPADPISTIHAPIEHLDLATVLKVSQAISSEIVIEKLIETIMRTAIETAGAERGVLILPRGDIHSVEAEATTHDDAVTVDFRRTDVTAVILPEAVFHYVLRTKESVLLQDASRDNSFSDDDYIRQRQARSILCVPLLKQSRLIGVLYLENNLTSHAFTPARMTALKLIASEAAISLENTRLYSELQEREARLRRLIESNIIGIVIWDVEGRIIDANDAFLQMLGYDRNDLIAGRLQWTELTPPEWLGATESRIAGIQATGVVQPWEKEYFAKDGRRVPVLVGGAKFDDPQDQGVSFVVDLSDRKRAEEALRRSEAFLAQGQSLSKTGSFFWHVDNNDIRFSAELYRLFEFEQDSPLTVERIAARVHPEDVPLLQEKIERARNDQGGLDYEIRLQMPDGKVKYCSTLARGYRAKDGGLEYYGAIQDITEQRLADRALSELRSELAHMARVTSLGALTASIAHEVNQPLSGIITNANTCLRMLGADPPNVDGARETARRTIRDSNRAAQVVTRLRALFSKKEPTFEPVDLNEATREVIALSLNTLQTNRVALRTELADDVPAVRGDRVQLQQVILNLVQNAIDAMATIDDRPRLLTIRTERDEGDNVRLTVQDIGIGLQADVAEQLFGAFYTTKIEGMGIGLSVSHSIIQSHGGRIWAEPNDGPGATFAFSIAAFPKM